MALIYYIHDLPKIQRWQRKMNLVSRQMAEMLQTVSQRGEPVTMPQVKHILMAAYSTVFQGETFVNNGKSIPTGYWPWANIFLVRGLSENKACVVWQFDCSIAYKYGFGYTRKNSKNHLGKVQHCFSAVNPSDIYSDLEIKEGETKIIIENLLMYPYGNDDYYTFSDGRSSKDVTPTKVFSLLLVSPKGEGMGHFNHFTSIVTFTPKHGLFGDDVPEGVNER